MYETADVIAAIIGLDRDEYDHLRSLHYLSSKETRDFVFGSAPEFLRSMPLSSELAVREDRSYPRGSVDWLRTISARMRHGGDVSVFVARAPQKSRDTSAARLFAYLLNDVASIATNTLRSHLPEVAQTQIEATRNAALLQLASLEAKGVYLPRSVRFSDISPIRRSLAGILCLRWLCMNCGTPCSKPRARRN